MDKNINKPEPEKETTITDTTSRSSSAHEKLIEITETTLNNIFANDDLMRDLSFVELDEIRDQISVLKGKSICVNIDRGKHLPKFKILIPEQGASVLCLKKAIIRVWNQLAKRAAKQKEIELKNCSKQKSNQKISWKYIWRTYNLITCADDKVLTEDNHLLSDYEIRHKATLRFIKKSKCFARKLN